MASATFRLSSDHKDVYVIARVLKCIWVRIGCHVRALVLEHVRALASFVFVNMVVRLKDMYEQPHIYMYMQRS